MTREQKELLIKDLCARLPYGVWNKHKLKSCAFDGKDMIQTHHIKAIEKGRYDFYKPYLFPLSSMTEEQRKEYNSLRSIGVDECGDITYFDTFESVDWCNKNHFDYRGLIPMGLAIDASGLNIY